MLATVDPAGLVQLGDRTWSLDWWVRAEDRWHHPSMEPALEQTSADGTAVVRTAVRVPGGEIVHECCAAQVQAGPWSGSAATVQVSNASAVPVALALVVRPYALDAKGSVSSVEMSVSSVESSPGAAPEPAEIPGEPPGVVVRIDGVDTLLFDHRPARVAHGTPAQVSRALATGADDKLEGAAEQLSARRWDAGGEESLEVAFVFPLAHTAVLGATLVAGTPRRGGLRRVAGAGEPAPFLPVQAPAVEAVRRGWQLHAREDPALSWVVDAASGFMEWSASMLRVAGSDAVTSALVPSAQDDVGPGTSRLGVIARALGTLPPAELHLAVAAALIRAQRFSGRVDPGADRDETMALVWVAAALLRAPERARHAEELTGPVAKALAWLDRAPGRQKSARQKSSRPTPNQQKDPPGRILATSGGPAALRRLAIGLTAVGQTGLAARSLELAEHIFVEPVNAAHDAAHGRAAHSGDRGPASPFEHPASELAAEVTAAVPGARQFDRGPGGPGRADARGFDVAGIADLRNRLLSSVVADTATGTAILGVWDEQWNGREVEVHRAPTASGLVSAALRWHGARPALLWEIDPWFGDADGGGVPSVTAPGLSADWSAGGWRGEALLD